MARKALRMWNWRQINSAVRPKSFRIISWDVVLRQPRIILAAAVWTFSCSSVKICLFVLVRLSFMYNFDPPDILLSTFFSLNLLLYMLSLNTLAPGWFWQFSQKKTSSFWLPHQRPSSSADCARELFNGSNRSASLIDCTRKKFFCLGGAGFLWVTS